MAKKSKQDKKPIKPTPEKSKKGIPKGVKVISGLYYVSAALGTIVGLILILTGGKASEFLSEFELFPGFFRALFLVFGILFIILGVISYFIARGLLKLKNWARIIALVFAVFGLVQGIFTLPFGIIYLVINGIILWYLGFNKEVKKAFV